MKDVSQDVSKTPREQSPTPARKRKTKRFDRPRRRRGLLENTISVGIEVSTLPRRMWVVCQLSINETDAPKREYSAVQHTQID